MAGAHGYIIRTKTREEGDVPQLLLEKHKTLARRGTLPGAQLLTIDIKAVPVQGEGPQLGDAIGLPAQLPVQLLSVQPGARRVRVDGADHVHSRRCSALLKPGEGRTCGHGILRRGPSGCGKQERRRQVAERGQKGLAQAQRGLY